MGRPTSALSTRFLRGSALCAVRRLIRDWAKDVFGNYSDDLDVSFPAGLDPYSLYDSYDPDFPVDPYDPYKCFDVFGRFQKCYEFRDEIQASY